MGNKTVKIGIIKTRLSLRLLKKVYISRVLNMTTVAMTNIVSSSATFIGLYMGI